MEQFSFAYQQIDGTIWAFASSLLMISLFFKFNRFWSVRNFDLILIILLAPSLIMVHKGMAMTNSPATQDQQASALLASADLSTEAPSPQAALATSQPTATQQPRRNPLRRDPFGKPKRMLQPKPKMVKFHKRESTCNAAATSGCLWSVSFI